MGDSDKEITVAERFAAGSVAGAFAQTAIFPMEVGISVIDLFPTSLCFLYGCSHVYLVLLLVNNL